MSEQGSAKPADKVARDAGLAVAARLVAMACTTITTFVVAGMLSKQEYGAYAIIFGIQVLVVMALDLGLTSSLARYVAQGRAPSRLVVSVGALRLAIIVAAAAVILAAPHTLWLEGSRSLVVALLPVLAGLVVAQSLVSFFFGLLPSLRRIRLLVIVTIAQPAVELALILVAWHYGSGVEQVVGATVVAGFLVSMTAWVLLLAPGRAAAPSVPESSPEQYATLVMVAEYGRRIFLVSLLLAIFGQIDQFVIGLFHPLAAVAPYALAIKVQAMLAAAPIVIAGIVAPRIAGATHGALELYRRWLAFLTIMTLGAVLTLSVLARELFGTFDEVYRDDWKMVPAMALFLLLSAIAPLPAITLNQTGQAKKRLPIALWAVGINVGLDLLLVPFFAAWGAVVATTIAFAYYFVGHHRLVVQDLTVQTEASSSTAGPTKDGESVSRQWFVRGVAMSVLVAAIAMCVRELIYQVDPLASSVVVLIPAGLVAASIHTLWALRIVR